MAYLWFSSEAGMLQQSKEIEVGNNMERYICDRVGRVVVYITDDLVCH